MDVATATSPTALESPVLKPRLQPSGCRHLDVLKPGIAGESKPDRETEAPHHHMGATLSILNENDPTASTFPLSWSTICKDDTMLYLTRHETSS